MKARIAIIAVLLPLIITTLIQPVEAQEMLLEYEQVLKTVAKSGDYHATTFTSPSTTSPCRRPSAFADGSL